jgi:predicted dehydrogenase
MGKFHAEAFVAEGAVIGAVYDDFPASAEALAKEFSAAHAKSLDDLLNSYDLDAISVCTPPFVHEEACVGAMRAGLAVLCEKPLAATAEQCNRIVAAQQQYNGRLMVAFFNRYFEPVARLREEFAGRRDDWGDVAGMEVVFDLGRQPTKPWLWNKEIAGGGALLNNGVHAIDLIRVFCGELEGGYVTLRSTAVSQGLDADAYGLVSAKSGAVAAFRTRTSSVTRNFSLEVEFAKARARVCWYPPSLTVTEDGKDAVAIPLASDNPLDRIRGGVAAFVNCLKIGDFSSVPSASDGAIAIAMAESLYQGAANQGFAALDRTSGEN